VRADLAYNFLSRIREKYGFGGLGGCARSYGQVLAKFSAFLQCGSGQVWDRRVGSKNFRWHGPTPKCCASAYVKIFLTWPLKFFRKKRSKWPGRVREILHRAEVWIFVGNGLGLRLQYCRARRDAWNSVLICVIWVRGC